MGNGFLLMLQGMFAGGRPSGPPQNTLMGANISGMEASPVVGVYIPINADFAYLRSKGVKEVRVALAWENIQKTLNGALDVSFSNSLLNVIALGAANQIDVQVDIHNFACYVQQAQWTTTIGYAGNAGNAGTGVNIIGDGTLTQAHYLDFVTKLATLLKDLPGYKGFGIMNEPSVRLPSKNKIIAPNAPYNTYGSQAWYYPSSAVVTKNVAANPAGAGYGPTNSFSPGPGTFGGIAQTVPMIAGAMVLSGTARCASGTRPMQMEISGTYTSKTVTTTPTRFEATKVTSAGNGQIGFTHGSASGADIEIWNMQFEAGSVATAYEPNPWNIHAQAAINAVRAVDPNVPIYVCGAVTPSAAVWPAFNYELLLLTGTNIILEAHQYFDGPQGLGGGGVYSGSWASYAINANTGVECVDDYLSWCAANGKQPELGEFAVPNGADQASWMTAQGTMLTALRAANGKAKFWYAAANGKSPSDKLNYTNLVDDPRMLQVMNA